MKRILIVIFGVCLSMSLFGAEKSKEAQNVMKFLEKNYGNHIISGQMDLAWNDNVDMAERIYKDTGTYPVLMGYDFMNDLTRSQDGKKDQVDEAIDWWKGTYNYDKNYKGHKGGLVAFCWHWKAGRERSFRPNETKTRIPMKDGQLDTTSSTFSQLKRQIDSVVKQLKRLQEANVPVLWRPLHEASGGWFWWGASGPEAYKALWIYMYNYMTNECGLNNLIWICNCENAAWYPGDEYVDIIGQDLYENNHNSQIHKFNDLKKYTKANKILTLSETGRIPDPELCASDGAWWSFFMVWNDATENGAFGKDDFWSSENINSLEFKKKVYSHNLVLTLDKIKDSDF